MTNVEITEPQPAYMTIAKSQLSPGQFYMAWKAGRFKEGEEVRIKVTTPKKKGRFTAEDIQIMRSKYNSVSALADKYGVTSAFIYAVRAKRVYASVPDITL